VVEKTKWAIFAVGFQFVFFIEFSFSKLAGNGLAMRSAGF